MIVPLGTARVGVMALAVVGALVPTTPASAATIIPNVLFDDVTVNGNCTLREAIQAANNNSAVDACPAGTAGMDTIILGAGTYTLGLGPAGDDAAMNGDLDITESLTIQGAGAPMTTIDGGGIDRVLHTLPPAVVSISDLTIAGGDGVGTDDGGGILNTTTLGLARVHVTGNEAGVDGGGIGNYDPTGVLTMSNSALTANRTGPASGADGGGIETYNDATATLVNVTISGNRANGSAGGLSIGDGPLTTLNNVTVTGNMANADGGTSQGGGAYFNTGGTLRNSIFAGNSAGPDGTRHDCAVGVGSVTSQGHNLVQDPAGCPGFTGTGDITGQDPMLGPLADNGGPTATHALLSGSPAIDAGDPAAPGSGGTACAATDQRGAPRNCDIGAYELTLCRGTVVNRVGTAGNDVLTGTEADDGFLAMGGNDRVTGLGGNDAACLGDGNDRASGGGGKDVLLGEKGNDRLNGGGGKDLLVCGPGKKDTGKGGPGKDKAKKCEKGKP